MPTLKLSRLTAGGYDVNADTGRARQGWYLAVIAEFAMQPTFRATVQSHAIRALMGSNLLHARFDDEGSFNTDDLSDVVTTELLFECGVLDRSTLGGDTHPDDREAAHDVLCAFVFAILRQALTGAKAAF